jgi:hypothetical protein
MKWIGKDKVEYLYIGKQAVGQLYYGATLIYEAIRSCFGRGFWRNNKAWINKESWRNK